MYANVVVVPKRRYIDDNSSWTNGDGELAQVVHIYLCMPVRMCLLVPLGVTLRTITTTEKAVRKSKCERESAHKA